MFTPAMPKVPNLFGPIYQVVRNPRYEAMIREATETRVIDFKAAMDWKLASKCEKFEILRDVAALANVGGGHIIIGRDGPSFASGSVTPQQAASFDPTLLNTDVHNYLTPAIECRVEIDEVDNDMLVVVEVPEFESSPLIFQEVGNCGVAGCKKTPHFRPGDVFIRTKAVQSRRVTDADEMRDIITRAVRKSRDELVTAMQRMLTSPQSVEEPLPQSPYDTEAEHEEREFFRPTFLWLMTAGHLDMTVRPAVYRPDRIDLHMTPRKIVEYAAIIECSGIFDAIPFEQSHEQENFASGARLRLHRPEWRRVEAVSLHTSGLYRIVRAFQEDYEPDKDHQSARFVETERVLLVDTFVEQMTLIHLLARNIGRDLLDGPDEEIQIDLRIDSLAGRTLQANRLEPLQTFLMGLGGQQGTENVFKFPLRTTLRALEIDVVALARERCARILWTFGLRGESILSMQRSLLGRTEPTALP
jgi:hypothetical protein